MYKKANFFISNNKLIKTDLFDISELEKGFSVYEVVKIVKGIPLFFEDHLKRLHNSAELKNKKIPFSDSEIKRNVLKLIEVNKIYDGRLKFAIRFYQSSNKLICFYLNPINPSFENYKNGINIISVKAERKNPNAKIINYKLRTFINKLISENNIFEVLLVNNNGIITECSKSSIFFVKNNTIYTSLSKDILPGITGNYIRKICKNSQIKLKETEIKLSDLHTFESAFITGTSIGVLPIKSVDNTEYKVGNETVKLLSDGYNNIVEEYLSGNKVN